MDKMFPFKINGAIKFRKNSIHKKYDDYFVQSLIYDSLRNQIPMFINTNSNTILFNRFIFNTLNNWNVLFMVDSGKLQFINTDDDTIINYSISTTQVALLQLIFIIFILLYNSVSEKSFMSPDIESGFSIYYVIPFVSSIYVVNYIITKIRFRKWLRDIVEAGASVPLRS